MLVCAPCLFFANSADVRIIKSHCTFPVSRAHLSNSLRVETLAFFIMALQYPLIASGVPSPSSFAISRLLYPLPSRLSTSRSRRVSQTSVRTTMFPTGPPYQHEKQCCESFRACMPRMTTVPTLDMTRRISATSFLSSARSTFSPRICRWRSMVPSTTERSSSGSNGLGRYASAPARYPAMRSAVIPRAVSSTTGKDWVGPSRRMARNSRPSISGIRTSETMQSGGRPRRPVRREERADETSGKEETA
mmetsp:Transcript_28206/g.64523  ORF Transcript_28206/g.64523 Transcript_28206/m.64523 type:complete len:248 (+) Transcript_28206:133-876(+)